MRKILFIVIGIMLYACTENKKSVWDMAVESYNTGIKVDTVIPNVVFGMAKSQLYDAIIDNISIGKYNFNVENLYKYKFDVGDCYFNDSLYKIRFTSLSKSYSEYSDFKPISKAYELKYGLPDTIIRDNKKVESYWFNGNLQISVSFSESEYSNHLSIEYNDLSKSLFAYRDSIVREFDNYGNIHCWTRDYYDNIYLPNERKKLNGI